MSQAVMDATKARTYEGRPLTPQNTRIYKGDHDLLCAEVLDEETGQSVLYTGVFAVLAFPVASPDSFVSIRYFPSVDREQEVGMIERPSEFDGATIELLRESLAGHYFEFQIQRIDSVELRWGYLLFDVRTPQGPRQFEMRWSYDRTQELGDHGKVLLDLHNNRYVIEDMRKLPREDHDRLTAYIYW
ncbi:MAG: DUF1854 domain-containing protein [Planctomycetota bacterium]